MKLGKKPQITDYFHFFRALGGFSLWQPRQLAFNIKPW